MGPCTSAVVILAPLALTEAPSDAGRCTVPADRGVAPSGPTASAPGRRGPGTLAVLLVYEDTWAVPFVAAARESGGELIAGARIPAQDVMEALDALDALEATEAQESRQPVAATPSGA
jgi:hypothetical protein